MQHAQTHAHPHTCMHPQQRGFFSARELAVKAPCECDKCLETNFKNRRAIYWSNLYRCKPRTTPLMSTPFLKVHTEVNEIWIWLKVLAKFSGNNTFLIKQQAMKNKELLSKQLAADWLIIALPDIWDMLKVIEFIKLNSVATWNH